MPITANTGYTVDRFVTPNRHGTIRLRHFELIVRDEDGGLIAHNVCYSVNDLSGCDPFDFESLAEARAHFEAEVAHYRDLPNWDLQAAYDAEHGTVNGYSPHDLTWRDC